MAPRNLSDDFMADLTKGHLKPILDLLKKDLRIDLQIRDNYVNLYYRGGNLLRIERKNRIYIGGFEKKGYFRSLDQSVLNGIPEFPMPLTKKEDVSRWITAVPLIKHGIDLYFSQSSKSSDERDIQQQIVYENNRGKLANGSDYFICDVEYSQSGKRFRFDLVAVHWPSTRGGSQRKKNTDRRLAFIELKCGDGSLNNRSGIHSHINDLYNSLDKDAIEHVKNEMIDVFNQKMALKLMSGCKNKLERFSSEPIEYIFILANHDPESKILKEQLDSIPDILKKRNDIQLKFAVSNFMGYCLYDECIYSFEEFRNRYSRQIGKD